MSTCRDAWRERLRRDSSPTTAPTSSCSSRPRATHSDTKRPTSMTSPALSRSALHAYINWNKRSVVIADPTEAQPWIAAADIVITTDGPTTLTQWPLSSMRSDAVHLSVTPFGLEGQLADAPAGNLTPQRTLRLGPRQRPPGRTAPLPALATVRLHGWPRRLRRRHRRPPPPTRIQPARARRRSRTRSDDPHRLPVDHRRDLPGHGLVARSDRRTPARRNPDRSGTPPTAE